MEAALHCRLETLAAQRAANSAQLRAARQADARRRTDLTPWQRRAALQLFAAEGVDAAVEFLRRRRCRQSAEVLRELITDLILATTDEHIRDVAVAEPSAAIGRFLSERSTVDWVREVNTSFAVAPQTAEVAARATASRPFPSRNAMAQWGVRFRRRWGVRLGRFGLRDTLDQKELQFKAPPRRRAFFCSFRVHSIVMQRRRWSRNRDHFPGPKL